MALSFLHQGRIWLLLLQHSLCMMTVVWRMMRHERMLHVTIIMSSRIAKQLYTRRHMSRSLRPPTHRLRALGSQPLMERSAVLSLRTPPQKMRRQTKP